MSALPKPSLSPRDYLDFERGSTEKHEFFDGEITAMSGVSRNHARIVMNLSAELRTAFKGHRCEVFASDLRLKVNANGLYTYPDLVVVCDPAEFEDEQLDTLLNPSIIIEVLSASTERYDRTVKFDLYRALPSLREYVLVSQDMHRVEVFTRPSEEGWTYRVFFPPTTHAEFASVPLRIALDEIYDRVELSAT